MYSFTERAYEPPEPGEDLVDIHSSEYAPKTYQQEELLRLAGESQAAIDAAGGETFYLPPDKPSERELHGLPHGPKLKETVYTDRFDAESLVDPEIKLPEWWRDLDEPTTVGAEPIVLNERHKPRRRDAAAKRAGGAAIKLV